MMRFRSTLILLLAVILGLVYFFAFEQPRHRREQQQRLEALRLTDMQPESVQQIRLTRGDSLIVLERRGDEWRITTPVVDRADASNTNVLVHSITRAVVERQLPVSDGDLGRYGLAAPFAIVELMAPGQDTLVIHVGAFNPDRSSCYIRTQADNDIMLVTAGVRRTAARSLFDFRSKRVADFAVGRVSSFHLTAPRPLRWVNLGPSQWITVVEGDTIRGDPVEVEAILRELRAMRAETILGREIGIAQPSGAVTLTIDGDSMVTYTFGGAMDGRCAVSASDNSRLVHVEAGILAIFRRTLAELRDRRVFRFSQANLQRMTIAVDGDETSIVRRSGTWSFVNPTLGTLDPDAVSEVLAMAAALKFRRVEQDNWTLQDDHPLSRPAFRMTLYDGDGQILDELRAGAPRTTGQVRSATSRSSSLIGVLDNEPIEALTRAFEQFRIR